MNKVTKILLIILLFGCLLNLPYGYYQFVRFIAMTGFSYLALEANHKNQNKQLFVYVVLALLFQPYIKIVLGKTIWNVVDVIVAIGLIISLLKKTNEKNNL
jgi:presenilin-like A22 family membrane protease